MDDEMKTISSRDINIELSAAFANKILDTIDGMPLSLSLSILNGCIVALASFISTLKKQVTLSDEDGLEKLVLSWLSTLDVKTINNFSKYISTECIDIDLSSLLYGKQEG